MLNIFLPDDKSLESLQNFCDSEVLRRELRRKFDQRISTLGNKTFERAIIVYEEIFMSKETLEKKKTTANANLLLLRAADSLTPVCLTV